MNNLLTKLTSIAATTAAMSVALAPQVYAISFNFNWQGDDGYSAKGMFGYDENTAPAIITESGPGPTNALDFLMVSFFDPANNPLQSFNTVANGVSESSFFSFNFDTSTQTLFGSLNVGGGISLIGEQFLRGTIGSDLELGQDVDQMSPSLVLDQNSGAITVTQKVPEPSIFLGLLAIGGLGLGLKRKKQS